MVDDSLINRKLLRRILEVDNYRIIEAENGVEAWKIIIGKENHISLILLDLTMPLMNGYELLEKMRENGIISSIPVIVTTGSEQDNAEIKSLDSGASDFITKPYNPELVRRRVSSLLRLFDNALFLNQLEIDKVTGLYSAEFFYRHAQMELDENPDKDYEIVCSNIESFRVINSKYGTDVGDSLLRYIANYNKENFGEKSICGRIGADIFAVLRTKREHHSQEEVKEMLNKIIKGAPINNFFMKYGVYTITDRGLPISDMCDRAQMAIESIKHQFGYCYAIYDDKFRQKLMREHQLNDYKEQALKESQFLVYLQPKHDSKTREIVGAEALVRWKHPELGFILPNEFIPLFERNGFITKLDEYVWNIACQILHRWQNENKKFIPISVNASRNDFMQENLPEMLFNLVKKYDIPAEMLHIEITESAYTDNPQQIISVVSSLRYMGFLIEMDDFGSGYSSLNMLSELPIDILKLDMRFMQQADSVITNRKRSILSFIISLSKLLELSTVAEGVETEEEVGLLSEMGCDYIQGYYFAKPMPIDEFEKYLIDYEKSTISTK